MTSGNSTWCWSCGIRVSAEDDMEDWASLWLRWFDGWEKFEGNLSWVANTRFAIKLYANGESSKLYVMGCLNLRGLPHFGRILLFVRTCDDGCPIRSTMRFDRPCLELLVRGNHLLVHFGGRTGSFPLPTQRTQVRDDFRGNCATVIPLVFCRHLWERSREDLSFRFVSGRPQNAVSIGLGPCSPSVMNTNNGSWADALERNDQAAPSTVVSGAPNPTAEEVVSKIKDDGDFDRLRLKIISQLKSNVSFLRSFCFPWWYFM